MEASLKVEQPKSELERALAASLQQEQQPQQQMDDTDSGGGGGGAAVGPGQPSSLEEVCRLPLAERPEEVRHLAGELGFARMAVERAWALFGQDKAALGAEMIMENMLGYVVTQ